MCTTRPHVLLVVALAIALGEAGCDSTRETRQGAAESAEAGPKADEQESDLPAKYKGIELAKISDGIVRVDAILGKTPSEVETVLGAPTRFVNQPISCVRFLPERVFFKCEHDMGIYAAPDGKAEQIEVEFEDGYATVVAFAGLVEEGEFDADKALVLAGLDLPGKAQVKHPDFVDRSAQKQDASVDLYSWWNGEARLIVGGKEHRVEVSTVNGEWRRSKVKVLNNHPLDEDQLARVKKPKNAPSEPDSPAGAETGADVSSTETPAPPQ